MEAGGYSYSEKHQVVYSWEILDFSSFLRSTENAKYPIKIFSPKFSSGAKIGDSWDLQLEIATIERDKNSNPEKWILIYLQSHNGTKKVRTTYLIYFLNNKREKVLYYLRPFTQYPKECYGQVFEGRGYGFDFVKINELVKKKMEFFPNDILTVGVDLTVFEEYVGISNSINPSKCPRHSLVDDFKDLLDGKKKSDVVINVGNKRFKAHKLVLITRSSVFDAMFSHNMKENKENEVTVPDDPEVFEKLLQFIYTDQVDDLDRFADILFEVADKYQLRGLKELCEDSLAKAMTLHNAIRILILADRHCSTRLLDFASNFVVINLASFKITEEFQELEKTKPSLFLAVLRKKVIGH